MTFWHLKINWEFEELRWNERFLMFNERIEI